MGFIPDEIDELQRLRDGFFDASERLQASSDGASAIGAVVYPALSGTVRLISGALEQIARAQLIIEIQEFTVVGVGAPTPFTEFVGTGLTSDTLEEILTALHNNINTAESMVSNYADAVAAFDTVAELQTIVRGIIIDEIQKIEASFSQFDAEDKDTGQILSVSRLNELYGGLATAFEENTTLDKVRGYVAAVRRFTDIQSAQGMVKNYIITRVNQMVWFNYNAKDGTNDLSVQLPNGEFKGFRSKEVTAEIFYNGIPFKYNRQAAVAVATAMAADGDRSSTSDGEVNGIQFSNVGTDSARFISTALRAGGIPMVDTGTHGECIDDVNEPRGWCVRPINLSGDYIDNLVWRNHNETLIDAENDPQVDLRTDTRLASYLLGNANIVGNGINSAYLVNGEYKTRSDGDTENYATLSVTQVIGLGQAQDGSTFEYAPSDLLTSGVLEDRKYAEIGQNLLESGVQQTLSQFIAGDYMVTRGPAPHGFMLTGFDAAIKCQSSPESGAVIAPTNVPYVTDLPSVQDSDLRPFYCTRLAQDFNDLNALGQVQSFFRFKFWYFIKVPDLWLIRFDRLYTDTLGDPTPPTP